MSIESQEKLVHIESADVDNFCKENASVSEFSGDSGVDTTESYSTAYLASSDSDVSPTKSSENNKNLPIFEGTENESDSLLSSPVSISPDSNDLTDHILCEKEYSLHEKECPDEETPKSTAKELKSTLGIENDIRTKIDSDLLCQSDVEMNKSPPSTSHEETDLITVKSRPLASSTVSLNEQHMTSINDNVTINKSPYSRSAEDISTIEQSVNQLFTNSSGEINAEKVLSEFASHKNKVSATQKIPEQPPTNLDLRYARLPKELLPQDLGSIVKNVHGIFSTVSGSLKNAYNNSHRMSTQKPPVKAISKAIPSGKVMNYIFEDDPLEENEDSKINNNEKTNESVDSSQIVLNLEHKPEQEGVETENDSKKDVLKLQVETLERMLADQRKENTALRERMKQQLDELQEKDHTFKDLENKLDLMSKRVDQAEREKDAAVMRYCSVECTAIEAKRAADKAAAAEKAAVHEVQLMHGKLKSAHSEKQRICQLYDDKCHELQTAEREVAKTREDIRELEGRLKWTQSKLRMEMDAYKESAERAEKLSQQLSELESMREAAVNNASDTARAKQLEAELKESQAALILCRHEKQELEKRLSTTSQQLETCVRERDTATTALTQASAEVEELKISNLRLEEEAAELAALRAQAALADTLSGQLQRESERCSRLEASLAEARALAETCARREASALEHAARLTAQHVAASAAQHSKQNQVQALTVDNSSLRERITSLEEECAKLQRALTEETERRNKENKVLARKVAEMTEELAEANKKLEWEKGENGVLKKKHASAIRELNRELHRTLKRCEQLESKLPPPDVQSTRAGSVTSLSSGESAPHEDRLHNGHADVSAVPDIQIKHVSLMEKIFPKVREPDRQALIERIVSLQRAAARRAERCEFLEEHSRQLTGELRAKSKLLRHLLCTLPAGAVSSQHRDANKKEIARLGGGAMAAVWGGDPAGMTLELSLEMNKRLQAVLEDALLKNITLKENMDTLGAEISRLKDQSSSGDAKPN